MAQELQISFDDMKTPAPAAPLHVPAATSSLLGQYRLMSTTIQNVGGEDNSAYVTRLATSSRSTAAGTWPIAVASSDHLIKVYSCDDSRATLTHHVTLKAHKDTITDLVFIPNSALLLSVSEDAMVLLWDTSQGKVMHQYRTPGTAEVACCAATSTTAAAGFGSSILLWSLLTGKVIAFLKDFHTDENVVTQVRFHPTSNLLFTGGEDGLINMFKLDMVAKDPDEALESVFPTEQPVSRFGFFGPNGELMYCLSTVETLSLWNVATAERVGYFEDLRAKMSALTQREVHSVVDCHYQARTQRLFLVASMTDGTLILFHVNTHVIQPVIGLTGGHEALVRDCLWFDNDQLLVTGGEDYKLSVWSTRAEFKAPAPMPLSPPLGGGTSAGLPAYTPASTGTAVIGSQLPVAPSNNAKQSKKNGSHSQSRGAAAAAARSDSMDVEHFGKRSQPSKLRVGAHPYVPTKR